LQSEGFPRGGKKEAAICKVSKYERRDNSLSKKQPNGIIKKRVTGPKEHNFWLISCLGERSSQDQRKAKGLMSGNK